MNGEGKLPVPDSSIVKVVETNEDVNVDEDTKGKGKKAAKKKK